MFDKLILGFFLPLFSYAIGGFVFQVYYMKCFAQLKQRIQNQHGKYVDAATPLIYDSLNVF